MGTMHGSPATVERRDAFTKHWWESLKPSAADSAEQLALADKLRDDGRLKAASREYRALVYNWPKSPEAPVAQFNHADCLERRGLYEEAFDAYQFLVDVYAGFFSFDEVVTRQSAIAWKVAGRKRSFFFMTYTRPKDAIPLFEKLVKDCPRCNGVPEMQLEIGKIYEEAGYYDLAIDAYQRYLHLFPGGALADEASFRRAESYYRLSRRSPNDKELGEYARSAFEYFLARHPESDMAAHARFCLDEISMIRAVAYYQEALTYEKNAGRTRDKRQSRALMSAAKTVYQRLMAEFPDSRWVGMAGARLDRINQKLENMHEE